MNMPDCSLTLVITAQDDNPAHDSAALLAHGLSAALHRPVHAFIAPGYLQLLEALSSGRAAIAWMPPLLQTSALQHGAEMVAVPRRNGQLTYRSALLVRADSQARELKYLREVRAAWRDPRSAAGCLFPRMALREHGIEPVSEWFYGSSWEASNAVLAGTADLCAWPVSEAASYTDQRLRAELEHALGFRAEGLRGIHVTRPIPPDAFMVARHVAQTTRAAVRDALVTLHQHEQGRAALHRVIQADKLVPPPSSLASALDEWRPRAA